MDESDSRRFYMQVGSKMYLIEPAEGFKSGDPNFYRSEQSVSNLGLNFNHHITYLLTIDEDAIIQQATDKGKSVEKIREGFPQIYSDL